MPEISLEVNGKRIEADVPANTLLADFLRDELGLTGTHVGCDTSQCGACTVHVNGNSVKSCTTLAVQVNGARVTTIEGLSAGQEACILCRPLSARPMACNAAIARRA